MKQQIRSVQAKAALAVNSSLIQLYWNMGRMIAENQALFEGRNSYVEQLAKDLRNEFPDISGFSRANLFYIRKFYQFYQDVSVQQLVGLNEKVETTSVQQVAALNESSAELVFIFSSVLEKYSVNETRMLNYAARRGKKQDLALFIERLTIHSNDLKGL